MRSTTITTAVGAVRALAFMLAILGAPGASAVPAFGSLFVFGDGLLDNGNQRLLLDAQPAPPANTPLPVTGNAFIPDAPYARGPGRRPAFTNDADLAEQFAALLGLGAPAPFLAGGDNVAYGSARMAGGGTAPGVAQQVNQFIARLDAAGLDAPSDGLYLIAAGGNDVLDTAAEVADLRAGGASDADIQDAIDAALRGYAFGLAGAVGDLALEGARNFLILNVPDTGLTPAARAGGAATAAEASALAAAFNRTWLNVMTFLDDQFSSTGFDDVDLFGLDLAGLMRDIVDDPGGFGFGNVIDACAAEAACIGDPEGHLFWDGIHFTRLGHEAVAAAMLDALRETSTVPAPSTLALVLLALVATRRRNRHRSTAGAGANGPVRCGDAL